MAKKKMIDLKEAVRLINDSEEDSVPKEIYTNPELYLELINGEEPYSALAWLIGKYMPSQLKADRALIKTLMQKDPDIYSNIADSLKNDKELYTMAIKSDIKLFADAGEKIKSDSAIVSDFLKEWSKKEPGSILPILWISKDLIKKNKFLEASKVKLFPVKEGFNRFVFEISQDDVSDDKSDAVLAKQKLFIETIIKDKKAVLFDKIHQEDDSLESESVNTFACLYIKGETLEDMDNYLNNLASKKIPASSTLVYDFENPNYMNYSDGEVSSGSIDSDDPDLGIDAIQWLTSNQSRNLSSWPVKVLDNY